MDKDPTSWEDTFETLDVNKTGNAVTAAVP
jgi:hypothetical protein